MRYGRYAPDKRNTRLARQLADVGGQPVLTTPYDGNTTSGGGWVLQCRWGSAGHTDAVLTYESSYAWDENVNQMRSTNFTTLAWAATPLGALDRIGRPEPVVWCQSPPLLTSEATPYASFRHGREQYVTASRPLPCSHVACLLTR